MPAHLLACLLCLPCQADAELESLIAAHEATMARIKAVALECDYHIVKPGEVPEHTYRQAVARDAARMRSRFEFPKTQLANGKKTGLVLCHSLILG